MDCRLGRERREGGFMSLHDYIAQGRARRLRYGSHDCVTFAGRWAEAQSGKSLVPPYRSLREGREILGQKSPVDVLARECVEVPVLMAQRGDVAVLPSDTDLPALGIVCGHRIACFVGREVGFVSLEAAERVFRCQQ